MKPEKPDFFLSTADFNSLPSSEYRFGLSIWFSVTRVPCVFSLINGSAEVKLADWRSVGLMMRVSVAALINGGGIFCRCNDGCWTVAGALMASIRLRIAAPSKGAPMKSSDAFERRCCCWWWTKESERRLLWPYEEEGLENSPEGRVGEGFERWVEGR
jgi:hypothetical protein